MEPDLSKLPRELAVPAEVERELLRALRRQGPLRSRRVWPAIAAAIVVIIAATLWWNARAPRAEPQYMLLLYDTATLTPGDHAAEYAQWARTQKAVIGGEELQPRADDLLGGYFLIRARNDAEANAIAQSCPHVKNGGAISIRRIAVH